MTVKAQQLPAKVHCAICSRELPLAMAMAELRQGRTRLRVVPGQKCSHCQSCLDAAYVLELLPVVVKTARKSRVHAA